MRAAIAICLFACPLMAQQSDSHVKLFIDMYEAESATAHATIIGFYAGYHAGSLTQWGRSTLPINLHNELKSCNVSPMKAIRLCKDIESVDQLTSMAYKYLKDRPELWHKSLGSALEKAYLHYCGISTFED